MFGKSENRLFVSLAPYFFNDAGHFREYHTELHKALEKIDIEVSTLVPFRCESVNLGEKWVRFFRHSESKFARSFLRLFDYCSLVRSLVRYSAKTKILFLEWYGILDLVTLLIAVLLFSKGQIHLWHVFRDGLEWNAKKRRIHLAIAKVFSWKLQGYKAFTDSSLIVNSLTPLLGLPVTLLPIPHTKEVIGVKREIGTPIRLWHPGKPRDEKGVGEILKFCATKDPCLREMELWIESTPELVDVATGMKMRWMEPRLSREEYLACLEAVDAVLLPYDPVSYISRSSGLFVEAICAGKMVFTRDGNWLAYELEIHDLIECILDWASPDAPSKLMQVLKDKDVLRKIERMQNNYCDFHNSTTFSKTIQALVAIS